MANLIVQTNVLSLPAAWSGYAKRGGHLTYVLHWLHGLKRLGHRVVLLNPAYRDSPLDLDRKHFSEFVTHWWSIEDAILLAIEPEESLAGMSLDSWRRFTQTADVFLTLGISGIRAPESLAHVRPRILVDQDPGYTHLWAEQSSTLEEIFGLHDLYCTVGLNVGTEQCRLPTLGIKWHRIVNPVIADWWQHDVASGGRFSTVADWWGQSYLEFEGKLLGPKREEFLKFIHLPSLAEEGIDLVLDISPNDADIERLQENGWMVHSPALIDSPTTYRQWIIGSSGEFSCAKGVYVGTNSGWFSDRTACYLAAGRPAVVQDTGLAGHFPVGKGLLAVRTAEEAADAIRTVRCDYQSQSKFAQQIARGLLDYSVVLPPLLQAAGIRR